ncbi:MAG: hypothetical protein IJ927_07330 [Eubacterium sp.]|nr:hypothetical protein [Eubacterium sp.]
MTVFNSRKTEYKSRLSAIKTNEEVRLAVYVPRSMNCSKAVLCVVKDSEDAVYYDMFWAGMVDDDREKWELHFSATSPGIYWYHFELDTPWGRNFVLNVGNGIGEITAEGGAFQQTVYDENYKTPHGSGAALFIRFFPIDSIRPARKSREFVLQEL